jgi:GNAT superfamily N-acetyltransferase
VADADIVVVGQGELALVTELYNQVFIPNRHQEFFRRRLGGRYQALILVANVEGRPVGFSISFELKPTTWFSWLIGVLPDYRRAGIATQLLVAEHAWAREHHYTLLRYECHNRHRAMLHLALNMDYDIVGIRWDPDRQDNMIIFEKDLAS